MLCLIGLVKSSKELRLVPHLFVLKKISDRNNVISNYNKLNQKLYNIENIMLNEKNADIRSAWTLLTILDKILKSMKDITDLAMPIKIK